MIAISRGNVALGRLTTTYFEKLRTATTSTARTVTSSITIILTSSMNKLHRCGISQFNKQAA
jgi:hypothetical protein